MMEYAALGIPIIAAKTTTISAYFDSDMVSFFQPGNSEDLSAKIIELYKNPQLRTNLIEKSNKFNEEYSWDKVAADYVQLVTRLGHD